MDLAYRLGKLTTGDAMAMLSGGPSNSTVRTLLRILEERGQLKHIEEEGRYVYYPAVTKASAAKNALQGIVRTFFSGSVGDVVATLLTDEGERLSDAELDRLQGLIDQARKENG